MLLNRGQGGDTGARQRRHNVCRSWLSVAVIARFLVTKDGGLSDRGKRGVRKQFFDATAVFLE